MIKILERNIINQIAAGEVVEKPASIVKELVENAIDANATEITVEIQDGGKELIKVTDNGIGIPSDQLKTAFMPHATSKIRKIDDLQSIFTLGFRGEALPSIASVSKVNIITKTKESEVGSSLTIEGGIFYDIETTAANLGTSITVQQLFYNIPVRQKFLKRAAQESSFITDIIYKMALSNPNIAFTFINNSNIMLKTNRNSELKENIYMIYGKETSENLIEVNVNKKEIQLQAYMGKPQIARASRAYEIIMINGRVVKTRIIQKAIEEAYKGFLMKDKFPFIILQMTIPPSWIDVNVHPQKLDVKFQNEYEIYDTIYQFIKENLLHRDLIPTKNFLYEKDRNAIEGIQKKLINMKEKNEYKKVQPLETEALKLQDCEKNKDDLKKPEQDLHPVEKQIEPEYEPQMIIENIQKNKSLEEKNKLTEQISFYSQKDVSDLKIFACVFGTFWICEKNDALFFIDQHAAHEKVLYERLMAKHKTKTSSHQMLLQPIVLSFDEYEIQIFENNREIFEKEGFLLEPFGKSSYALRACPYSLSHMMGLAFFNYFMEFLKNDHKDPSYLLNDEIFAQTACKAAVKANDKLSDQEVRSLLQDLFRLENPYTCPHGRPTIVKITKYEVEKMFKRVVT